VKSYTRAPRAQSAWRAARRGEIGAHTMRA